MSDRSNNRRQISRLSAIKSHWQAGYSRSKIAKITGISYVHVKNTIDRLENEKTN